MTRLNPLKPASLALVGLFAIVAVAIPANALPALPVGLPAVGQHIDTPVGSIDAAASQEGATACLDAATPALPAVPPLPVPTPVPLPAVPAIPDAKAAACASAGLDGIDARLTADAAGAHADAQAKVDASQTRQDAEEAVGGIQGFLMGVLGAILGFF